jgi:hypothetical protein
LLNKFSSLVSLLSPFSSLVMQTPIFLTKLSDESIIFIIDVGKNTLRMLRMLRMLREFLITKVLTGRQKISFKNFIN